MLNENQSEKLESISRMLYEVCEALPDVNPAEVEKVLDHAHSVLHDMLTADAIESTKEVTA